jgi:hypothetical protein
VSSTETSQVINIVFLGGQDSATISASESTSGLGTIDISDSSTISATETAIASIVTQVARSDSGSLSVTDTSDVNAGRMVWKAWDGTQWVTGVVKVWDGSAWVIKPVKRWTGEVWL